MMFSLLPTLTTLLFALSGATASPLPEVSTEGELAARTSWRQGGQGTYFYPGLGACGWHNGNNDMIVAISQVIYAGGEHCGKYITISARGKTERAKIVDECPGCGENSLDMSPALFKKFAPESVGVFSIKWAYD